MELVAASTLTPGELADVRQICFDGFEPHLAVGEKGRAWANTSGRTCAWR